LASLDAQSCPDQGGVVARMVTENLSVGGLYCTSDADFPEMTRVVVRREVLPSNSGNSRYKLGLFFTNVDDDTRRQLLQFLS
jgi:hypothetical protein